MSLAIAAIVIWGFGHTVNQNLFHAAPPRPLLLWFHAAVFSGWVAFFIFQSALVRTHNVKWHRFFGWFGMALAAAMVPLGVATAIVMVRFDTYTLHMPGGNAFLIVPLFDMVAFTIFFSLAIVWRKKSEFHRRFIFIATCGLVVAAFGRVAWLNDHDLTYYCVDLLILLGAARDLVVAGAFIGYIWSRCPCSSPSTPSSFTPRRTPQHGRPGLRTRCWDEALLNLSS